MKVVITGTGFHGALARTSREFCEALRSGKNAIRWTRLARSGRALPAALNDADDHALDLQSDIERRVLRGKPASMIASCTAATEALRAGSWRGADCAIVVAGSNLQQAYAADTYERFREKPEFVNPRYAATFLDTTLVAAISEIASLRDIGFTTGGGMASGNVALFQAWTLIRSGAVRACLCIGAMADFSEVELVAFSNLGALATPATDTDPATASRPFDERSQGFVYGQAAAAVLVESAESAAGRGATPLAELAGAAIVLDGDSGTEPHREGETAAMQKAMTAAGIRAADVDYVNTHGTGTPEGDRVECAAIRDAVGTHPLLNATKALTGHTIGAAGVVELVATIIQMKDRFVHPNPFLEHPIDRSLRFAGRSAEPFDINVALSNSFSIGGFNTSVVVRRA